MLHCEAQEQGDYRNNNLQDPCFYVVYWASMPVRQNNRSTSQEVAGLRRSFRTLAVVLWACACYPRISAHVGFKPCLLES